MTRGVGPLMGMVSLAWLLVWVASQLIVAPPLPTTTTLIVGLAVTNLVILGYPSVLRGPRQRRRRRGDDGDVGSLARLGAGPGALRQGLTLEAAERTVDLLRPLLGGDAVAITDRERMLAFAGPGADHHTPGSELWAPERERVMRTGRAAVSTDVNCREPACPLGSAAFAPLVVADEVVGTVTVYRQTPTPPRLELVEGVAGVLSLHLELARLEAQARLSTDTQLEVLRAQINPHFLFNVLNTIASKARTDPSETRQLLLRLADFFRYAIDQRSQFAEFAQEYFFVRTYVTLEQARFGDGLRVEYDVDPQVLGVRVPVLMIQPLIENAIKHGISRKVGRGTVTLRARVDPLASSLDILVRDDGVGMDAATLRRLREGSTPDGAVAAPGHLDDVPPLRRGGVGLRNIDERLALLFGDRYELTVRSRPADGTDVRLRIPLR
ncbi:histidine kinase [Egicoccus sp. AB-alg6-2]|uniref:histidine kinase n=1 Tax=Egicoccus sp. AB-alg6-2 TaxID=3242692 RepID=UPI00359D5105